MADSITAPCRRDFYPAFHESGKRSLGDIRWIVLHDEESTSAAGAARYFQSPTSGGSAHLCVDDQACYRCLSDSTIPWGAASSFGANSHGIHIEQAGYAKWSAVVWKSHLRTLKRAAYKTAVECRKRKVPVVFVGYQGLIAGKHGITTHNEVSKASRILDPANASEYSHSDPGPLFPRHLFMSLVRYYTKRLP